MKTNIYLTVAALLTAGLLIYIARTQPSYRTVTFRDKDTQAILGTWPLLSDTRESFIQWCLFNNYNPETIAQSVWAIEE